jgi:ACS family tartrate transporter-like MFS transporter
MWGQQAMTGFAERETRALIRKIAWRTLPLILLSYFVAVIDRSNISFAAATMNADLGFSETIYGIGASAFFAGYALLEIPSNLLLARFGARRWLARIMLTWGLISVATAFVHSPMQFYAMRFALGVAEAGFYPGAILYISSWFPGEHRAWAISRFYIALPLSFIVMGSIAAPLLALNGWLGLHGWQILETVKTTFHIFDSNNYFSHDVGIIIAIAFVCKVLYLVIMIFKSARVRYVA